MKARVTVFLIIVISVFIMFRLFFVLNKTIYSNVQMINNSEWLLSDTLTFEYFNEKPNINHHNIILFGKINQAYSYANLYLFVDVFFENNKIKRDTLNCVLYDSFGFPQQKNIGNTQFFKLDYLNTFNFETNKNYTFKIIHGMRDVNLIGIEKIGIKINKN
tara:strand:+ start:537 stop:1019 length:483 start_codon:yes stop_codon:yes gene_type:complete